jgi:hypothetical protein
MLFNLFRRKTTTSDEEQVYTTLRALLFFLVLITFCVLISMVISKSPRTAFVTLFAIGGAYLLSGAVIGFLFAIPKSGTGKQQPAAGSTPQTSTSWYDDNTNLEEVSDWLTKIIIGLTLVQFNTILTFLHQSSRSIASAFSIGDTLNLKLYPLAYGLIIFFIACGFAIGYLWTRINFALILTVSRKRLTNISTLEAARDKLEKEVVNTQQVLKDVKKDVTAKAAVGDQLVKDHMPQGGDAIMEQLRVLALQESTRRPVEVPLDAQKGRWGGKLENKGKKINVTVLENSKKPGYFDVTIQVESVDKTKPLTEPVALFVDKSFLYQDDMKILWPDPATGIVTHTMLGYEAFTIGALFNDGTDLEIDLNDQPGYPTKFYWGKK